MKKIDILQKLLKVFAVGVAILTLYYVVAAVWDLTSAIVYHFPDVAKEDFWVGVLKYVEHENPAATLAYCWSGFVYSLADTISFAMVLKYLIDIIKAGTPFTPHAARHTMWIGVKTIFLPLVAELIALFIHLGYGVGSEYSDHMPVFISIIFGIVLLFVSLLLHHGAELEEQLKKAKEENKNP